MGSPIRATPMKNYSLGSGDTAPRGAASTADEPALWIADFQQEGLSL